MAKRNDQNLIGYPVPGLTMEESREWHRLLVKDNSSSSDDDRFWELDAKFKAAPKPERILHSVCSICDSHFYAELNYKGRTPNCCGQVTTLADTKAATV